MTDNDNQPELTPAEQHQQDLARVERQLDVTDVARKVTSIFGGNGFFARTDFEGHELNIMIDMVLNANPADLESAGDNLWNARKALRDAAEELRTNIKDVHWEGTSGEAFRDFGRALADHADQLGTFADIAATQIRVAGTGLASVRSSMPERDTRIIKHNAKTMPLPERIDTNPDFVAAKKVEKNRQEAINQMNRLASFYAVSEQTLAGQEPPKFSRALNADVPPPAGTRTEPPGGQKSAGTISGNPGASPVSDRRSESRVNGERPDAEIQGSPPPGTTGRSPSMELDSVAPPLAPPTNPNAAPPTAISPAPVGAPPVVQTPTIGPPVVGAPPSGLKPGPAPSLPQAVSKSRGAPGQGGQNHVTARGAAGQPSVPGRQPVIGGSPASSTGGSNPVGRPAGPMGPGQTPTAGRANSMATGPVAGAQGPMAGRSGTPAQPATGRTGASSAGSRAGREGVVGGTPQQARGGSNAPRIPRGTIVGAEAANNFRAMSAGPGSGVIGGGAQSVNGVVGSARTGSSTSSRADRGNFTTGGTGLVGGRPHNRTSSNPEEDRSEARRPDFLTEDEETWTAQRRNAGPPVIE
ncbi:hypothetical protein ACFYXL_08190 [Streptomyces tsukubensis]|uniref:WXG100 family type VII secretion target n=1 Tax=Streptomyces tsukubensis TaxID=83656 RepID=UPI0036868276